MDFGFPWFFTSLNETRGADIDIAISPEEDLRCHGMKNYRFGEAGKGSKVEYLFDVFRVCFKGVYEETIIFFENLFSYKVYEKAKK